MIGAIRTSTVKWIGGLTPMRLKKVEEIYEMISPHEHILLRPDMYIGSVALVNQYTWLFDDESEAMSYRKVPYSAGLYKIVDEILVNAADNHAEEPNKCKNVSVMISENGEISIRNDGSGIPVVKHKSLGVWLPVMLFGHLLTSSNYRKNKKHMTGGRFGYGAKLTNILSKEFIVETLDEENGLKCRVRWHDNMKKMEEPEIKTKEAHESGYTMIRFTPDYEFFGMKKKLSPDMYKVIKRRLFDFSGLVPGLSMSWNGNQLSTKDFLEYSKLYPGGSSETVCAKTQTCEIILRVSVDGFHQVSFVNSVHTNDGGTHVDYVMDTICEYIFEVIKKSFASLHVNYEFIRSNIFLFLNCSIPDPEFDSQNKSALQSPVANAGFPALADLARRFVERTCIIECIKRQLGVLREEKCGTKDINPRIDKLIDAEAVDSEPEKCTLIVVEGDSARSFALTGLNIIGQKHYGVFALKGKIPNAMHITQGKSTDSVVTQNLLKSVAVTEENGKFVRLRYGKILLMTDQDNDGTHIKALVCNLLLQHLPCLLRENRLYHFVTPLVSISFGKEGCRAFYTIEDFDDFISTEPLEGKHSVKYYKGLGSHNEGEVRSYFLRFDWHVRQFHYSEERDRKYFIMAFDSSCSDKRKKWLLDRGTYQESDRTFKNPKKPIPFEEFFQSDYVKAAIELFNRSMPHYVDGLCPIHRKIVHCIMQNKGVSRKVVQLAGYVSHHCAYHHGEENISASIIHLAQNFVGSNNLPLLHGEGNFGTRLEGGDDHAQARYIFVKGSHLLPYIFRQEDNVHLTYKRCEGIVAEPEFYCPIVPLHLVNGCEAIAYGWRSHFPKYKPLDVIEYLRTKLQCPIALQMSQPSFIGFNGSVEVDTERKQYRTIGKFEKVDTNGIHITELPVGTWTSAYQQMLSDLKQQKIVHSYLENHRDGNVDIHVYLYEQILEIIEKAGYTNSLQKLFRLVGKRHNIVPVCSSSQNEVLNFPFIDKALDEYMKVRLRLYESRSATVLQKLEKRKSSLEAHVRFLGLIESKKIKLGDSISEICEQLRKTGLDPKSVKAHLKLDISSLTVINEKRDELKKVAREISSHKAKTPKILWLEDLADLEKRLKKEPTHQYFPMKTKSTPTVSAQGLVNLRKAIQSMDSHD